MDIATIITLVQWAVEEEPKVQAALQDILTKKDPTVDDWNALKSKYAAMQYSTLVPNSEIPPGQ